MNKRTLLGTDNILDLQDNGYKSTVSAISEIIDNSIQADAQNINIVIVRNTTRDSDEIDEILIIDDGEGMDELIFDKALQMSSGTKSKAKSGLGKYGQGLPNSSISQTRRVEVYTKKNGKILFNYIDLEEIFDSKEAFLPDIEIRNEISIPLFKSGRLKFSDSGTIVRWVNPNRVKPKTAKTLVTHIQKLIGRTFRYFLNGFTDNDGKYYKTKIGVSVFDFNGVNYEPNRFDSLQEIIPFDPMFLMENTQMNHLFPASNHPTSISLLEERIIKSFKVNYNGEEMDTVVELKISYCKKEERDRYGRNAGRQDFGKAYLHRNLIGTSGYHNISIIRAGREIEHGNFGFLGDVSDNRERWWSAEIIVEPIIDSIIGIDNKKQQASNIQFIDTDTLKNNDVEEIIRWISTFLDENISAVKKIITLQNAGVSDTGSGSDSDKPPGLPGGNSEPGDPAPDDSDLETDEVKEEFFKWIKERYQDLKNQEIKEIVDYALSMKDNHIFVKSDLGDTQLYSYKVFGTKVLIEINYNHSFYQRFMLPLELDKTQENSIRSIRLLISAMVNSELLNKSKDINLLNDRKKIRNRMFECLDEYIDYLYS
jgi:hypothetical protein